MVIIIKLVQIKKYTGIGSRETPDDILLFMNKIAHVLYKNDYILRSGGSDGADKAFEKPVKYNSKNKEIYLPWEGFNKNDSPLFNVSESAFKIASRFHPYWNSLKYTSKLLIGRNVYQILGFNLNEPSDFVICWTKNGEEVGGTGTTIKIAKEYNVPVFNLFFPEIYNNIFNLLFKYYKIIKKDDL